MDDRVIIFLDDDPNRAALMYQRMKIVDRDRTMWCQTADQTIEALKSEMKRLHQVHLDHDLGGQTYVDSRREDTGMEVVRWLEKRSESELFWFKKAEWRVHTWNPPAGERMTERLRALGFQVVYRPFGM